MFRATKCLDADIAAYFTTMRSKLDQGINSITCELPRLKSQYQVRDYRQNPKRVQVDTKKTPKKPYIAALFYKIILAEPESTDFPSKEALVAGIDERVPITKRRTESLVPFRQGADDRA
jgi:hypothetical protein